jgi:N-acetylmuramoyl-L-alanine amidase
MVAEEFYLDDVLKDHKLIVLNHADGDNLNQAIRRVNEIHNKFHLTCAAELHFNASTNPKWHGSEVLYTSNKGRIYADIFQEELTKQTNERERRIFNPIDDYKRLKAKYPDLIHKSDFIKGFLTKTRPVCVILEPAYMSNPDTARKLQDVHFLNDIAQGIINGFRRIIENEIIEASADNLDLGAA